MIIKLIFLFARAFIYVAYPAYTFKLYASVDAPGGMVQLWISAVLSVIGVYLLIQKLEDFLRARDMWSN
jgi:hypothetical protein